MNDQDTSKFVALADERNTDVHIMRYIAHHAENLLAAEHFWANKLAGLPRQEILNMMTTVSKIAMQSPLELQWDGSTLFELASNSVRTMTINGVDISLLTASAKIRDYNRVNNDFDPAAVEVEVTIGERVFDCQVTLLDDDKISPRLSISEDTGAFSTLESLLSHAGALNGLEPEEYSEHIQEAGRKAIELLDLQYMYDKYIHRFGHWEKEPFEPAGSEARQFKPLRIDLDVEPAARHTEALLVAAMFQKPISLELMFFVKKDGHWHRDGTAENPERTLLRFIDEDNDETLLQVDHLMQTDVGGLCSAFAGMLANKLGQQVNIKI